ncbi:MAG: FtsQ-type POTRA domain-containing protein [Prolixibacteraceae bacterium]|nr:FtsQ-type POTRA domain-containing protein [Prolixibacteraceae bacterium]
MLYKIAGLFTIVIFIVVSLSFTTLESRSIVCNNIQLSFDEENQFVSSETILNQIQKSFKGLNGAKLDTINTNEIERVVEQNPWVKNAEVFKGYSKLDTLRLAGGLKVNIEQEVPIMRIVHGAQGFYLNEDGKHLPFSSSNTLNVVVITGETPDEYLKEKLLPFVMYISNNEFWNAQVQQIHVLKNQELLLVPRAGDQLIEFGEATEIEKKFRNLKAVYKNGFTNGDWTKYKKISLKFDNQVICTRK